MIPYEIIISAVHDRGDLMDQTVRSMLTNVDQAPERVIIHEDARPDKPIVEGRTEEIAARLEGDFKVPVQLILTRPGTRLPRAMLRLLEASATTFVLYNQEDLPVCRPVPIARCLEIMERGSLNSVIFNKRNTLRIKGEHQPDRAKWWTKREVSFDGQPLCIAEHWRFQLNLGRRALFLEGVKELLTANPALDRIEHPFNGWLNTKYGDNCGSIDGDQDRREKLLRTFIWGPVGEPRFIQHSGALRRTQGWDDPEHDRKHGTVRGEKL